MMKTLRASVSIVGKPCAFEPVDLVSDSVGAGAGCGLAADCRDFSFFPAAFLPPEDAFGAVSWAKAAPVPNAKAIAATKARIATTGRLDWRFMDSPRPFPQAASIPDD